MALSDPKLGKLVALIQDSFRVRENHDPVYVEMADNLTRVRANQHQVIFGRRGSGKSCLLVHFHRNTGGKSESSVYVSADEVKTLSYPDVLVRLLLTIFKGIRVRRSWRRPFRGSPLSDQIRELQELLDRAETAQVKEDRSRTRDSRVSGGARTSVAEIKAETGWSESRARSSEFREEKLDYLERHLSDYKDAIAETLRKDSIKRGTFIIDDFYLIHPSVQPDVIDYFHRLVRGTDLYLKIGTVRHRTSLSRQDSGQTVGVELYQDVEAIDLDHTFEDVDATHGYLKTMLDSMGSQVGVAAASEEFVSPDGLFQLTLASGGVPRDYLTIFVEAIKAARDGGATKWLTPRWIYKGAARVSYRTKLSQLRDDAGADAGGIEPVFQDLLAFCLKEKKKTGFLIAELDARAHPEEHDLILQLMDFKLIHVIEPDTSAASGREGRYEAYTLDFAFFMEPRLRGIDHIEFWMTDEQRRRRGVREAPVYELGRVIAVRSQGQESSTEQVIEEMVGSIGEEEEMAEQTDA